MKTHALILAATLALAGGCATASRQTDTRPIAKDPVCLYNNDLGCVCVRVDKNTPCAKHNGQTYYFCSENCRTAFEKNPEKYLKASRKK